jgi:hypothetical protein
LSNDGILVHRVDNKVQATECGDTPLRSAANTCMLAEWSGVAVWQCMAIARRDDWGRQRAMGSLEWRGLHATDFTKGRACSRRVVTWGGSMVSDSVHPSSPMRTLHHGSLGSSASIAVAEYDHRSPAKASSCSFRTTIISQSSNYSWICHPPQGTLIDFDARQACGGGRGIQAAELAGSRSAGTRYQQSPCRDGERREEWGGQRRLKTE